MVDKRAIIIWLAITILVMLALPLPLPGLRLNVPGWHCA